MGGTVLEPNVPSTIWTYDQVMNLIEEGFPVSHIVLRVDPIFISEEGIARAVSVFELFRHTGITRVRYSFVDFYSHVVYRFSEAGLQNLVYERNDKSLVRKLLDEIKRFESSYCFESCAEPTEHQTGCISKKDFEILKINYDPEVGGFQRELCLCAAGKTELLSNKTRCPHKCLYCYWKD